MATPVPSLGQLVSEATSLFKQMFGDKAPQFAVCAPGRVNLIGDHTDYNQGYVLPMVIYFLLLRPSWQRRKLISDQNCVCKLGITPGHRGGWKCFIWSGSYNYHCERTCRWTQESRPETAKRNIPTLSRAAKWGTPTVSRVTTLGQLC